MLSASRQLLFFVILGIIAVGVFFIFFMKDGKRPVLYDGGKRIETFTVTIEPPPPNTPVIDPAKTPNQLWGFVGVWHGVWKSPFDYEKNALDLPASIAIEQISTDGKVRLTYAWGSNSFLKVEKGIAPLVGKLKKNTIYATSTLGSMEFLLKKGAGGDALEGTYYLEKTVYGRGVFYKENTSQ